MAVLHQGSTISPTKPELLAKRLGGEAGVLASYRFDDPEGEVGIEAFVVRYGDALRHVVLTYRGAPLDGGEAALVSEMDHTELGKRWVYDGAADPVARECFRRAVLGEVDQAALELWADHRLVGVKEPTVTLTARPSTGEEPAGDLAILADLDQDVADEHHARLEAAWDGGHGVVAILR
ncbi:MAG: hypothetical protein FWE71_10315 [Nocardioidaceae bacterium]|nr:hypothetical protein [Nocardioidaceae bacterium]MCL2614251.1 hypothetical protein [Nocardioidaceae bacterium]